jgi:hypothetical protein
MLQALRLGRRVQAAAATSTWLTTAMSTMPQAPRCRRCMGTQPCGSSTTKEGMAAGAAQRACGAAALAGAAESQRQGSAMRTQCSRFVAADCFSCVWRRRLTQLRRGAECTGSAQQVAQRPCRAAVVIGSSGCSRLQPGHCRRYGG